MEKDFVLGLIGGIFGILAGSFVILLAIMGEAFGAAETGFLYGGGSTAILLSIAGIVAPILIHKKKWIGVTMIISGIIVLIAISLYGVLTAILFILGGVIALKNRKKTNKKENNENIIHTENDKLNEKETIKIKTIYLLFIGILLIGVIALIGFTGGGVEDEASIETNGEEDIETYTLNVDITGEGSIDISPDQEEYEEDTEVTITASPEEGWKFTEWTGDHIGTEEETIISMGSNKEITAHFEEEKQEYNLTINVEGQGSTTPYEGTHTFAEDEEITLKGEPNEGWTFDKWTGDTKTIANTSSSETKITINEDKQITAYFAEKLKVLESEMQEVTTFMERDIEITGIVENIGDETISSATITARLYDSEGIQLDTSSTRIEELDPGVKHAFTVDYFMGIDEENIDEVDSYDVKAEETY